MITSISITVSFTTIAQFQNSFTDPDNKTETPREKHLSAKSSYSDEPFEFSTIDDELVFQVRGRVLF